MVDMVGEIDGSRKAYVREHALETYKSLIQIASELSRVCILANGGAAIALLSYLGDVASKEHIVPNMAYPMFFYVFGVFNGCSYVVTSWFTQIMIYKEDLDEIEHGKPLQEHYHVYLVVTALFLVIIGIICFLVGSILAALKFPTAL